MRENSLHAHCEVITVMEHNLYSPQNGQEASPTSAGAAQGLSKRLLLLGGQLPGMGVHVEGVDGFVGLGVDRDPLDVPTAGGNRGCQIVEQAGPVFRYDFDQGGRAAAWGVYANPGGEAGLLFGGGGLRLRC